MERIVYFVRRLVFGVVVTLASVLLVGGDAGAKVHGVSQAGCAHDPSASGANRSGANSPSGPIPVTSSETGESASDGAASPESGGDGAPDCDTPAEDSRQDH